MAGVGIFRVFSSETDDLEAGLTTLFTGLFICVVLAGVTTEIFSSDEVRLRDGFFNLLLVPLAF